MEGEQENCTLKHCVSCDSSTYLMHVPRILLEQERPGATLAKLFIGLTNQMQLKVSRIENKGQTVQSVASTRTSAILFGSCPLEVKQRLSFTSSSAQVQLEWLHPLPEEAVVKLPHVWKGVNKRAHFIKLFNSALAQNFKDHTLSKLGEKYANQDCSEDTVKQLMEETTRCRFARIRCNDDVQKELEKKYSGSLLTSSTKLKKKRTSKVSFAASPSVITLPLTPEEREARMSFESSLSQSKQPNSCLDVHIKKIITPEERRKIAPFNYTKQLAVTDDLKKVIAPFNYTQEMPQTQKSTNEPKQRKKRSYTDQDNTVKVVPHQTIDSALRKKKFIPCAFKRFRPEIDRRVIAPFNYSTVPS